MEIDKIYIIKAWCMSDYGVSYDFGYCLTEKEAKEKVEYFEDLYEYLRKTIDKVYY